MFGKKVSVKSEVDTSISVQTIPADFYGGVNPEIKFKKVEKEVVLKSASKLTAPEKKMLDKSTAAGSGSVLHPANILTNKKYAIILGASLFTVIVAGVSVYYYLQLRQQPTAVLPIAPKVEVAPPVVTEPIVVETPVVEEVSPTNTAPSLEESPI